MMLEVYDLCAECVFITNCVNYEKHKTKGEIRCDPRVKGESS